MKTKTM